MLNYFTLSNKVSAIDLYKQNAIIDISQSATRTLIGALRFCRAWRVFL